MTETAPPAGQTTTDLEKWLTPGVRGIGSAGFLADVGHEVPTTPAAVAAHLHPRRTRCRSRRD